MLAQFSIARPVFTIVLSLLIVLLGLLGLTQLGVREYPSVDPPTISISTSYPGAAAEVMQAQVTETIEEVVNTVAGIRTLTSTTREGASQVSIEFSLGTDIDTAASDVRDQLARAARYLPPDINPPILSKAHADSSPIFNIALSSEQRTQLELGAYANTLAERLQTVPGIASVDQAAEKRYAMRLWMDPEKLTAYNLSPLDIRAALERENIELPSGRVEGGDVELPVKTLSRLNSVAEFNALVVKRDGDRVVRFSDVGYAELGAQNERGSLRFGTVPIAGLNVRPQPGANQVDIVDELRRRLGQIKRELPPDVRLDIAYDNTQYVRQSLHEVSETILVAFVLVVLVVFAFLREWRTTLIPVLAIPVSIVGAFAIIYLCGFSINTLTLLGIVLAIGIVVDDAIVVLENIHAKVEDGMAPLQAGIAGTREIFFAVIATTITLVVVFLPLLFMSGMTGRLFREFGVTIAGAVLISALVALTLTPMLSARLLKPGHAHGKLFEYTEPFFRAMERGYARSLAGFLQRRWLAPVIGLAAGALGYVFFTALPRELSPMEDRGRLSLRATAAEGVGYDYMQAFMDDLTNLVADTVPEAVYMITQTPASGGGGGVQGPANTGTLRIFLSDKSERTRSQSQIAAELQERVRALGGARVNVTQQASIGERRANETGVRFVVQAPTLDMLREGLPDFIERARQSPVFSFVDSDLTFTKPEVRLTIERDKAQALGVSTLDIAQTLQASLSGQRFGYFIYNGRQYDVIGQLTRDFRSRPQDLANIAVPTPAGGIVRLDNVVTIAESSAPPELFRYNRYNAATVSGTLAPGRTMDEGIAAFDEAARATLDERFSTSLSGSARDFVDSAASLLWVFGLALVLIYLVLAAQFESFLDPLLILLTVPLAIGGALAALWLCGQTLNIFSQIGLIMLIGLVTKNGILIVEFANQRRVAGVASPLAAIQQASAARLRPILMTTLAMTLGILPIALALGAGSESRVSMGIAVIGGLLASGALTLYVIPAAYLLLPRSGEVGGQIATASDFSKAANSHR